MPKGV